MYCTVAAAIVVAAVAAAPPRLSLVQTVQYYCCLWSWQASYSRWQPAMVAGGPAVAVLPVGFLEFASPFLATVVKKCTFICYTTDQLLYIQVYISNFF